MRKKKKENPTLRAQTAKVDAIAARLQARIRDDVVTDAFSFADSSKVRAKSVADESPRTNAAILDRYHWKEVHAPRSWYPTVPGSELVGFYGGRTMRNGSHGQYDVILVHVPSRGSFMVSGTKLMQLIDAAMIDVGHPIRVVWEGLQPVGVTATGEPKQMKLFKVLVAEGEPIDVADLPRVSQ